MATSSSIVGRIAFGPNAGQKVTRIGSGFGYYEEIPLAKATGVFLSTAFPCMLIPRPIPWLETALESLWSIYLEAPCRVNAWRSLNLAL
jgi:hypothetical protein